MKKVQTKLNSEQDIWYRNPMVWFIILLPLGVVVASMITISIALKHAPELISQASDTSNSQQDKH